MLYKEYLHTRSKVFVKLINAQTQTHIEYFIRHGTDTHAVECWHVSAVQYGKKLYLGKLYESGKFSPTPLCFRRGSKFYAIFGWFMRHVYREHMPKNLQIEFKVQY